MPSSGMLCRLAVVRTDVSEEGIASIVKVIRIGELRTTLIVELVCLRSVLRLLVTANVVPSSSILLTLAMEAICSSETSVLARATRLNIPEDGILHVIAVKISNLTNSNKIFDYYFLISVCCPTCICSVVPTSDIYLLEPFTLHC
jgi:hypothetical protein